MTSVGDAADVGSIPGLGRSPGGGKGNWLQYSWLNNSTDREVWWATGHGVTKSWTRLCSHTHEYMTNSQTYQLSTEGKAIFYKKEIWNTKQISIAVIPQNLPWKGCHILGYPYTEEGEYRSEWPWSMKIFFIEINTHQRQSTIKEALKIQEGSARSCPPASVQG